MDRLKKRILWAVIVLGAAVGFYFAMVEPALTPEPPKRPLHADLKPTPAPVPELPIPAIAMPEIPAPPPIAISVPRPTPGPGLSPQKMEVPIQNGATIDFSTGAPQLRMQGEDKAALDRALREMAEATKDTTFGPPPKK